MNKKNMMMMTTVAGALALLATGCVTDCYYTTRETYCTPAYVETVYPATCTYTRVNHHVPPRHAAVPRHEKRRDHGRHGTPAKHTTKPTKHVTKPDGHAAKPTAKQKPAAKPARKPKR